MSTVPGGKTARRLLYRVLVGCTLLLLLLLLVSWLTLRFSLPTTDGERTLPGLQNRVTVRFDDWHRPYVEAETLGDALQAQGWLHADNRLWQMELLRRAGQGRLSELLGVGMLETDRELWRNGVPQLAAALEANAAPETLQWIDRYLAGVNTAIAGFTFMPPEFLLLGAERPAWVRRDVFALGALMAFQSANNQANEWLRLALSQVLGKEELAVFFEDGSELQNYPFVLAPDRIAEAMDRSDLTQPESNPLMPRLGFGSNGWVVAAEKSATGVPLFAFDSHDDLGLPNLFYEIHLFFGSGRQLRGWSVPGLPGVINGYNESIAWGFTNIGDTQDLFIETRSDHDPMLFLDGDDWYRARSEEIIINVAGGQQVTFTLVTTRNGPLISEDPPVSLAWTIHRIDKPSLDSLIPLNLAANWSEFNEALDLFPAPTLNATYADIHGTIGFRTAGVLPLRGCGQGLIPQDGSDPDCRWQGLVPATDMPRQSNPEIGFLAAANARVNAPGDGPLVSADNAAPYRIQRIQDALGNQKALTAADMQALQVDWDDGQARMLLPGLIRNLDPHRLEPFAAVLAEQLEAWSHDPVANRDSGAALAFQQWYLDIARRVFADRIGDLYPRLLRRPYLLNHALDHLILHAGDASWWRGDRAGILSAALNDTARELQKRLESNPTDWRLDQLQRVHLGHELGKAVPLLGHLFNHPAVPWGGGPSTVGRARYSYTKPFEVNSGATVRVVAEMGDVPRVAAVIPGGQAGHPLSAHYDDQYTGWLGGALHPVAATAGDAHSSILILKPENER